MGSGSKLPCKKAAPRDGGRPDELRVLSLLYLLYILDLFVLLNTFTACASLPLRGAWYKREGWTPPIRASYLSSRPALNQTLRSSSGVFPATSGPRCRRCWRRFRIQTQKNGIISYPTRILP